jgi:inhibitor of cysteine peptidase
MPSLRSHLLVACAVAAVALPAVAACQPTALQLTERDNGTSHTVAKNQELTVTLESNPSTGYSWQVTEAGSPVLEQVGEAVYQAPTGTGTVMGAAGTETLRFKAVQSGTAALGLGYTRPWESNPPEKTFTVTVSAR